MLLTLLSGTALAGESGPTTLEERLAAEEAEIAKLSAQLAEHPETPELWESSIMGLAQHRGMLRMLQGLPWDEEADRRYLQGLYGEWIRARPDAPEAHLGLANALRQESRTQYLAQLAERFPAAPEVQRRATDALRWAGDHQQAERIVEGFLAGHPELPEAHALAYSHFQRAGNAVRARQVLAAWVVDHPGDPAALSELLSAEGYREEGREHVAATLRHGIDALQPSPKARGLCARLSSHPDASLVELGLDCYQTLLAANLSAEEQAEAFVGLAQALDHTGDTALSEQILETLSPENRSRARIAIARQRADNDRCAEAAGLLEQAEVLPGPAGALLAGILGSCGGDPSIEQRLVGAAARLDAQQVRDLLMNWWQEQPLGGVEALALEHLRRHPDDSTAWNALESAYEKTGERAKRLALLRSRIETAGPEDVGSRTYEHLAKLLVGEGRIDEAITLYEDLTTPGSYGDQPYFLEQLAGLYLRGGQFEPATKVAERILLQDDDEDRGDLILARIAAQRGDWAAAFEGYQRYLAASGRGGEPLQEFAFLAVAQGRQAVLFTLLEERHAIGVVTGGPGDKEDWVASQLEELGFAEPALAYLEIAAARSRGRAELHRRIADAAEELGEWDRAEAAWRALLELDPENSGHWYGLGALQLRRGDPARALQVIDEAVDSLGSRPSSLGLLLGEAHLAAENPLEAIRVLRQVLAEDPGYYRADDLLRSAYEQLARADEDPGAVTEEP